MVVLHHAGRSMMVEILEMSRLFYVLLTRKSRSSPSSVFQARTLLGGRSERNEFLLLHAFDEKYDFIVCYLNVFRLITVLF